MKPRMQARFEQLLRTESEMAFFFILAGSLDADILSIHDEAHGFGIRLSMQQNLTWQEPDRTVTQRQTTHVFSLYEDGTLTWAVLGQPVITGLRPIQETFKTFKEAFLR